MPTTKARKLLEHGLKDMYDAEQRFVDALGSMIENANDRSLADGFRRHREVTKGQVKRLEKAFDDIGARPQRTECPAARGLVREYEKFVQQEESSGDGMLDTFAASAGLKVEHYEIASYRALIDLAEFCDYDKAARALKQNLAEEEQAAAEMQAAATKLSAKLADAPTSAVAGRAVGAMFDQVREGTMTAVGGVMTVGERAVGRARGALKSAEQRGRQRVGASTRKRTTSTARRATSTARKTTSKAKSKAKSTARTARRKTTSTARRATSTAKRTGTTTARRARATASRTTGRAKASTRRTTTATRRGTTPTRAAAGRHRTSTGSRRTSTRRSAR